MRCGCCRARMARERLDRRARYPPYSISYQRSTPPLAPSPLPLPIPVRSGISREIESVRARSRLRASERIGNGDRWSEMQSRRCAVRKSLGKFANRANRRHDGGSTKVLFEDEEKSIRDMRFAKRIDITDIAREISARGSSPCIILD